MKKAGLAIIFFAASLQAAPFFNSFNSGELSPLLKYRVDLDVRYMGVEEMENFLVKVQGSAVRRPGSEYIGETKGSGQVRLIPFEYSTSDAYMLEFGDGYIRFFRDGGQILDSEDNIYEIESPYEAADLRRIQYIQSNDVMYLVHPDRPPQKLARYGHDNWTIETVNWQWGPFLDENADVLATITPSAAPSDTTSGQTYTDSDHYGGYTADLAFDDIVSGSNGWLSDTVTNQWVCVQFSGGKTIKKVRVRPCRDKSYTSRNARRCKLEGSNDGAAWTKIAATKWLSKCSAYDTNEVEMERIANYTDYAEWEVLNSTSYTYYRLYCHDNWGSSSYIGIKEIELFESASSTFIASTDIWEAGHVGSIWKLTQKSASSKASGVLDANETSSQVSIEGDYLLTLTGTWSGLVSLEKSNDGGATWGSVYQRLDGSSANVEYAGSEKESGYRYRVAMSSFSSGSAKYTLTAYNPDISGYIKITSYVDPNEVTAVVVSEALASDGATSKWSEGAWSDVRGWPGSICLYQNRLCLAGTSYQTNGLWCSKSADYENMAVTGLDDGAISYEIGSACQNPIVWLTDRKGIIAATSGSIISIASQSNTSTLTAASIGAEKHADIGGCFIAAEGTGDSTVFVDRGGRKVFDMVYDLESDSMVSPELTVMAEHITDPCLVECAGVTRPDPAVWFVRGDGEMAVMTYDRRQQVTAWTRIVTDGRYESVAAITQDGRDEVWTATARTVGGSTVRYIERFKQADWGDDNNDIFYVDSGLTWSSGDKKTIIAAASREGELYAPTPNDYEYVNVFGHLAQSFTASDSYGIGSVMLYLYKNANIDAGDDYIVEIRDANQTTGKPTATVLATATMDANDLPLYEEVGGWPNEETATTITLSTPVELTEGTVYTIVVREFDFTSPEQIYWGQVKPGTYSTGSGFYSSDDGATWTEEGDYLFKLYKNWPDGKAAVEVEGHGFEDGWHVRVSGTEMDGVYTVSDADANSFAIQDDDGYIDGELAAGYVQRVTQTVTGLDHLNGRSVDVFAEGLDRGSFTVADCNVILDDYYSDIAVGLPYTSTMTTFPIEIAVQSGFSVCYKKRLPQISACFYRTIGGEYGLEGQFTSAVMYPLPFSTWPVAEMGSNEPYSGQIRLDMDGGWDDEVRLKFVQDDPYPMAISGIAAKIEISEN